MRGCKREDLSVSTGRTAMTRGAWLVFGVLASVYPMTGQMSVRHGTITPAVNVNAGSRATFRFNLAKNDRVETRVRELPGVNSTSICSELKSPTGVRLDRACTTLSSILSTVALESGTYSLEVYDTNAARPTRFFLILACQGECPAPPPGTPAPVLNERRLQIATAARDGVTQADQLRRYFFPVKSGSTYTIDAQRVTGGRPCLEVFDGRGQEVFDALCTSQSSRATFTATGEGDYQALVYASGFDSALTFDLASSCQGAGCMVGPNGVIEAAPGVVKVTALQGSREIQQSVVQLTGGESIKAYSVGTMRESWISASPSGGPLPSLMRVLLNPRDLPVGVHKAKIPVLSDAGQTVEVPVEFEIRAGAEGSFEIDAPDMKLSASGDPSQDGPQARIFSVRSTAKADLAVSTRTKNGSPWLSVSPATATVSPGQSVEITLRLQASALPGGVLKESVVVSAGGVLKELPVEVTVNQGEAATPILSTKAITLFAQIGGSARPRNVSDERSFILYNLGPGTLDWFATSDSTFLQVAPQSSELLEPHQYQRVSVVTTPAIENLETTPGQSRQRAAINFRFSPESPSQKVDVFVKLANEVPPRVSAAGVVLLPGGTTGDQLKIVHSENSRNFEAKLPPWLEMSPNGNFRLNNRQDFPFVLQIKEGAEVTPGMIGDVVLTFPKYFGNQDHVINLSVLVGGTPGPAKNAAKRNSGEACVATRLFAIFVTPGNLFRWEEGLPMNIEARIVDDCGVPLSGGGATLMFSSGEAPVSMSYWPDGLWRATWTPTKPGSDLVRLRIAAVGGSELFTQAIVFGTVTAEPKSN